MIDWSQRCSIVITFAFIKLKGRCNDRIFWSFYLDFSDQNQAILIRPLLFIDHLWPNDFQCCMDQARNGPFRLPDDWCRHVRWRNELLRNHKKWKSFNSFSEKGMNTGLIRIALNYSFLSILVNRQSFLILFILYLDLETIFWNFLRNFGLFSHNLAHKFLQWAIITIF